MGQDGSVPALTRDEAETRAALLDVHSYDIDLDLTRGDEVFGSTTTVRFGCRTPGAGTFVELRPVTLRQVVLNGTPLDPADLRDNRLPLTGLAAENELVVHADMAYSRTGEGLHRFTDPADGKVYLYAQTFLDAEAAELLTVTAQCLDRFHDLFGIRYPFGKYDQAFVPEFNAGAMENPGCVTFRDEFVFRGAVTDFDREQRAMVVAHEMAHMWFGDLVTMRW